MSPVKLFKCRKGTANIFLFLNPTDKKEILRFNHAVPNRDFFQGFQSWFIHFVVVAVVDYGNFFRRRFRREMEDIFFCGFRNSNDMGAVFCAETKAIAMVVTFERGVEFRKAEESEVVDCGDHPAGVEKRYGMRGLEHNLT